MALRILLALALAAVALAGAAKAQNPGNLYVGQPIAGSCTSAYLLYNNSGILGCEAAPSTGLTIGTTPITGGATTQVLFNLGGVVSSDSSFTYAGSGGLVKFPPGTFGVPGFGFSTTLGFWTPTAAGNTTCTAANGGNVPQCWNLHAIGEAITTTGGGYGWSASATNADSAVDTALMRKSAGVLQVSTSSTTGNDSGTLDAAGYQAGGTAGLASKTCTISALGATITITGGIVTATTGC